MLSLSTAPAITARLTSSSIRRSPLGAAPRGLRGVGVGPAPVRAAVAGARPISRPPARRSTLLPTRRATTSTLIVAASSSDPSPLERAAAAAPFLIPLVDALSRGRFLFLQFPEVFGLILAPIRPLAQLYYSVPFASLGVFFLCYLGVVQNQNFSRFARYNAMQAILLDLLLVFPSLLERVVGGAPKSGAGLSIYMSASSFIFLFVLVSVIAAGGSALAGKTVRLPLVADAADAQTRF